MPAQPGGEIAAWLRLQATPGVGNATIRRLLAAFSLPQAVFQQSPSALERVVSAKQAQALLQAPPDFASAHARLMVWLENPAHHFLTLGDAAYPQALLCSDDPPLVLYVDCADAAWWQSWASMERAPLLAMVGSRKPSPQGLRHAQDFAAQLVQRGYSVVSGLAQGIDAAAHQGALDALAANPGAAARTLAVVGTGLDVVYPRSHAGLAERIVAAGGAIVSEYPLGTQPLAANFPRRNRIIAGLSLGTLVVEAALKSGSLITARLAMENNREVFAIPGSIHATQHQGCHALIKQGAQLVEEVEDIVQALPASVAPLQAGVELSKKIAAQAAFKPKTEENTDKNQEKTAIKPRNIEPKGEESALLRALGFDPVAVELLLLRCEVSAAELQIQLLQLEMQGMVQRLPGGLVQRIA